MSRRDGLSRRKITAAVVREPDAGGDLTLTEWVRLEIPPDWIRIGRDEHGGEHVELTVEAVCKLTGHRATIERLKAAAFAARCPFRVIRPEDCE